jgi:hypothetical protein
MIQKCIVEPKAETVIDFWGISDRDGCWPLIINFKKCLLKK